jgi:hypothetical protein
MDSTLKAFLESGSSLITDTMQPKTQPVKMPKKGSASCVTEKIEVKDWDKALISRCKDEKIPKKDVVAEFKKIIDREEELI